MTTSTFADLASELDDELCTWPRSRQLFTRANALDQWPLPITPLTQDLVELPQERGLEGAFASVLGVSKPSPEWTWNGCFYGYVMFGVTPAAELAENLPGWNKAGVYADYLGVHPDPAAPPEPDGPLRPAALARIGARFLTAMHNYPRDAQAEIASARAQLDADRQRDWSGVADAYLRERALGFHDLHVRQRVPHAVASVISAALFKQLNQSLIRLAGEEDGTRLAKEMITPLGGVHMREAIDAMGEVHAGRLSREVFVREYGFRGTNEFELATRTWGDAPETLDRLLEAAGRSTANADSEVQRRARRSAQECAGWRWPLLRRQLAFTESHLRWRENGKVPMALGVASIRYVVREAARRLADRGRIDDVDDAYYLRRAELVAELGGAGSADLAPRIARRRATRQRAMDLPLPEIVDAGMSEITEVSAARWKSLGLIPPATAEHGDSVLIGVGGSHGSVTGRARIVTDPADVEIDEGDIVVARGTDSAWTPLFLQADAVVVDIGGVMSHACIAAREVGIPCVIDVKNGTSRIAEGQMISVDGDSGTVTLL
jgi:phosphohistidine swiveling domain-containing protein